MGKLSKITELLSANLKTANHTMDIEGFLFASGFAVLVVLVGWANQITSRSRETKDLEADFLKKAKLKRSDYKKIVNEGGSTDDSFKTLVGFLYTKKEEDLQVFEKIKFIKVDIENLDRKYDGRFWILLWMSISLFVTGGIAFILPPEEKYWAIAPNLILIILAFINLIEVHNIEKRYAKNISEAMEKL